jgi:hypothetical protein
MSCCVVVVFELVQIVMIRVRVVLLERIGLIAEVD